ncbi:MAG: IS630 family transposase [Acidocella sp.]|nr:IS630 family transposase [Acidocella sp.]
MAVHGWKDVVYFDESGFQANVHRPHGWASRGNKVFGKITGNNHKRTNLIMAQRGKDWIAPMLFKTSCTHLTVTAWIKEMLLPTLRPQSLVVMDNAPFHNKPKIAEMLTEHGHKLLPLPRYSPDFNPIEKAFAILKRKRIFSGKSVDELIASHS